MIFLCPCLSLCHRLPCIAFRGQLNRSYAVGCAKWSCVPGDKWDTSFLNRASPRSDEYIHSRVRTGRFDWPRWLVCTRVRMYATLEGVLVLLRTKMMQGRASYRIAQGVAAMAWNYNGCGDVTTFGCTMLSAIADAPSGLNKRMTAVKFRGKIVDIWYISKLTTSNGSTNYHYDLRKTL